LVTTGKRERRNGPEEKQKLKTRGGVGDRPGSRRGEKKQKGHRPTGKNKRKAGRRGAR